MKALNTTVRVALTAVLAIGLGACSSKKSSSSTTATTPKSTTCTWNGTGYVDQSGNTCTPSTSTVKCPSSGQYQNIYGIWKTCTPGQTLTDAYPAPNGYPGQGYPSQGNACSVYLYQWPYDYYVPANLYGQWVCLRMDLFNGSTLNTGYDQYGYNYYYAYPPYAQSGCSTPIHIGGNINGQYYGDVNFCLDRIF